jgi:predicted TIM-barrel fold metal-dependent hydrolase
MIIDVHTHIFPKEIIDSREKFFKGEPEFASIYKNSNAKMITAEELISAMKENNVDKSVVFGFPWNNYEFSKLNNDYILEATEKYKDKLIGLACFNPLSDNSEKEAERCLEAGLKGVGEIAFYLSDIDSSIIEALKGIMEICRKFDAVFMLHTNEPVGHEYPGKADMKLKGIYNFVKTYVNNKIILAHMGGGLFFFKSMKKEVDNVLENVYYDTAAVPFLYKKEIYNLAKVFEIEDKILFGSDYPLIPPKRYFKDIETTVNDEKFKTLLTGENAKRLFKIEQ